MRRVMQWQLSGLISLALMIPNIAVGVRCLHDVNKSGWWMLIVFIIRCRKTTDFRRWI
ncbi:DUF805 domain-containing protein [Acinetobacter baumannii]|uniref:DUF805 domain-containing protein n=1 Tax=Acinetobacter baumannii TaxID=470 RepID=UPI0011A86AE3|nr:DUF805 domain-containing protein [Acinetobacter baumannii]MBF6949187.1 DUF805 domain-containing protein [Acinetobacter baumannii]MDI4479634.1 DUF805 domain-containing protein [Moraxella osloensis]